MGTPGRPPPPANATGSWPSPASRWRSGWRRSRARSNARARPIRSPIFETCPFGRENTYRFGLSASQPLHRGRLRGLTETAGRGRRSAELGVTAARAQTLLEVTQAYYDATLGDRLVSIAEATLRQAETTLSQATLAKEVGEPVRVRAAARAGDPRQPAPGRHSAPGRPRPGLRAPETAARAAARPVLAAHHRSRRHHIGRNPRLVELAPRVRGTPAPTGGWPCGRRPRRSRRSRGSCGSPGRSGSRS